MTSDDDIQALRRSVSEPAAFDALFVRHHIAIRRYLHARVGDAALAEDLAAETFVRAFAARARFRDQGHGVRAWLFQIATNLLRDEIRAGHRRSRAAAPEAVSVAAPDLPADPALGELLRQLPREQLEVLLLHAWADLGYEEIAVALDIRVGTVRSRLHRARAHLRRSLPTLEPARPAVRPGRSTT
ncbi:ECF RNA polymerase sigma factor SigE [Paraconexibacter sp. AEG42_29]|uniref:ECF RNA polymerase sigma factor SigE n=1 Tax=Paraconexibacter sp. AEG42_29 TaxID=2997339 RepID=A0AAU7AWD6_9ACTN